MNICEIMKAYDVFNFQIYCDGLDLEKCAAWYQNDEDHQFSELFI